MGRAQQKGLVDFRFIQIRDFATDKHRTVDDTPYGGGEGMVMRADVLKAAWKKALPRKSPKACTVFLSPQGRKLDRDLVVALSQYQHLVLVCGHYEGIDERFIEKYVDLEVSIGDYVLTGGELPALVLADAVARRIPGVVGKEGSVLKDSLEDGLLKYPQYTRPREFEGAEVPAVLLSGNHAAIAEWRKGQSLERTARKRPDLLEKARTQSKAPSP
jgi:tRNA (guanine37-N1)-methyltransferase